MKLYFFLIFIPVFFMFSCANRNQDDSLKGVVNNPLTANSSGGETNMPAITFERTDFDFGRIYDGEKVKAHFKFTNTGKSDLIITGVNASCGCTVPEYPKTPIKSGGEGSVAVEFNSSGRKGQQVKTVTVSTNAQPPTVVLTVRAMVVEP
jgi:hypothetical protein